MVGRAGAGLERDPAQRDQRLLQRTGGGIKCDRLGAGMLDEDFHVVLQVLPDARQVVRHLDAVLAQMPGGADSR